MRFAACALLLAACQGPPPDTDVVGPFTGPVMRFLVDEIRLPLDQSWYATDLDGQTATFDNALGRFAGFLDYGQDLVSDRAIADQLAVGRLSPWVELQADSLDEDSSVGLTFHPARGAPAATLGGAIIQGDFSSNPPATTYHPVAGDVVIPLFAAADPLVLHAIVLHARLRRMSGGDPRWPAGWNLELQGAALPDGVVDESYRAFQQQVAAQPGQHPYFAALDTDDDGAISRAEFAPSGPHPDVALFDASGAYAPWAATRADAISFGLLFHLVPCADGDPCSATTGAVIDSCDDRIRDGYETDVDCGPGCAPCAPGLRCSTGTDCQSGTCEAGVCGPATCSDGHLDGLECAVDRGPICHNSCPPAN